MPHHDALYYLPEFFLSVMAPVFLFVGVCQKRDSYRNLCWLGAGIAFIVMELLGAVDGSGSIGTRFAILGGMAVAAALVLHPEDVGENRYGGAEQGGAGRPEYPALALFVLLGVLLMLRGGHGILMVVGSVMAGMLMPALIFLQGGRSGRMDAFRSAAGIHTVMGLFSVLVLFGVMLLHGTPGSLSQPIPASMGNVSPAMVSGASFVVAGLSGFCGILFFHGWLLLAMESGVASLAILSGVLLPLVGVGCLFLLLHGPMAWALPFLAFPLRLMGALSFLMAGIGAMAGRHGRIHHVLSTFAIAQGGLALVILSSMKPWAASLHAGMMVVGMTGMMAVLRTIRRKGELVRDMSGLHAFGGSHPLVAIFLLVLAANLALLPPLPGFALFFALLGSVPEISVRILLGGGFFLFSVGILQAFSVVLAKGGDVSESVEGRFRVPAMAQMVALACVAAILCVLFLPQVLMLP